jgi:hypothetical protein
MLIWLAGEIGMQKELVSLFSRISVPGEKGEVSHLKKAHAVNLEAGLNGFALDAEVIDALSRSSMSDIDWFRTNLHSTLSELVGSDVDHKALFNNFPYDTPKHHDYLMKRVIGYLQNTTGVSFGPVTTLSCGHFISNRLFPDLSAFSACPICQEQVDELSAHENVRHPFKDLTPFRVLQLADTRFVREQAFALLSRTSSLSLDERHFVRSAIDMDIFKDWNRPVPDVVYRENVPFVYLLAKGDLDQVRPHIKSATDILRIAAYLSNGDADLTLREKTDFKLKTSDRKALLTLLNEKANLPEDMLRHRPRWLKFDKHVGAGSDKIKSRYPQVWETLRQLRDAPGKIETFNRQAEKAVRSRKIDTDFLDLMASRPGELMRKLDFILRNTNVADDAALIDRLETALPKVTDQLLLAVWKYTDYRARYQRDRVFIPAGNANRVQLRADGRKTIKRDRLETVHKLVEGELVRRFAELPSMGSVYVDPELRHRLIPFNRRGDSSTMAPILKGNAYPIGEVPAIRLFTYWKGDEIDVDLSAVLYDANFKKLEGVNYQRLQGAKKFEIIHSGDIQSAPNGASEFIDFSPDQLAKHGVRYVLTNLISFRGHRFHKFECFGGFMVRDALRSGQKFEPKSVEMKFNVNTKSTNHVTLAFDCVEKRVIFLDIVAGNGRRHQNIGNTSDTLSTLLQAAVEITEMKPTYFDVMSLHAKARGVQVKNAADADFIVSAESVERIDVMNLETMAEISSDPIKADLHVGYRR